MCCVGVVVNAKTLQRCRVCNCQFRRSNLKAEEERAVLQNSQTESAQAILDKRTMAPWAFLPLVTLWHHVALLVSAGAATDSQRKTTQTFVHRSVDEVPAQGDHVQPFMARIGTNIYHSQTVSSVTMLPGYRAGSLVWLALDPDIFMEAKVQKAVFDPNASAFKYDLWLGSDCLPEVDEGHLVQPLETGCYVSITALGEVCTAQLP